MHTLGRYQLHQLLGEGGAGRVYQAVLQGPGGFRKSVALKVLHSGADPLKREARIGGLLRHPENLLLSAEGVLKVADLGIARLNGEGGRVQGTPGFMPPEQAFGGIVDRRSDVYALGVTLATLSSGARPTASKTLDWGSLDADSETLNLEDLATGPKPQVIAVPDWLAPVVDRCLMPNPADRWPDMASVAAALNNLKGEGSSLKEWVCERMRVPETVVSIGPATRSFVGRQTASQTLRTALEHHRWVTLKGPAGVGKSRLAVETLSDRPHVRCELADADSHEAVLMAISRAIDVPLRDKEPSLVLAHGLKSRGPTTLLLDNSDTLNQGAFLSEWLRLAPELRLLVTSRTALNTADEHVIEVPPLADCDAQQLLVDRALERGVALACHPQLADLAAQLDGLPLALELAAGRLGVLSVPDVLADSDLSLLRQSKQGRHGTLLIAIDASWQALSAPLRNTLNQLCAFSGGFDLEAAEQVLRVDGTVLDEVQALMDRSMVRALDDGRFAVLRSVAVHARARGEQLPEAQARHAEYFANLGKTNDPLRPQSHAPAFDNTLTACRWAIDREHAALAAQTFETLWRVLDIRGPYALALGLADQVLALSLTDEIRPKILSISIRALRYIGNTDEASHANETLLDLYRAQGNRREEGIALGMQAMLVSELGQRRRAISLYEAAIEAHRDAGDRAREGISVGNMGVVYRELGEMDQTRRLYEEAIAIHQEVGNGRAVAILRGNLATVHYEQGRLALSLEQLEIALAAHRDSGDRRVEALVLGNLSLVHLTLGEHARALRRAEQSLQLAQQVGEQRLVAAKQVTLGSIRLWTRSTDSAMAPIAAAVETFRALQDDRKVAHALGRVGAILATQGDINAADKTLQEARGLAGTDGDPAILAELIAVHAEVAGRQGNTALGRSRLRQVAALNVSHNPDVSRAVGRAMAILDGAG